MQIDDRATGSTNQAELTAKLGVNQVIRLPAVGKHPRIVAKIDELMVSCVQLEEAGAERDAIRERPSALSVPRFNESDLETFHDDARFALNALTALTTRSDKIKRLHYTILNLAVLGKLV